MSIRISAIICTLNRSNYLRSSLQSLANQTLLHEYYEILIVDNGSVDDTKKIVLEEFSYLSNLRYIYEPIPGLSQARNTGCRNAKGEYVAYLDDDAIASHQWLEKILEVFHTIKPQPGCIGGKVEPIWEAPQPNWMPSQLLNYFTMADYSTTPIILNDDQFIVGANIVFPKKIIESIGEFQTKLGRTGKKLLSMEENLFQEQIRKRGYSCFYHPEIAVKHHIPASRISKKWLLRRLYWEGISASKVQVHRESPSNLRRLKLGIYRIHYLLLSPKRLIHLGIPTDKPEKFSQQCLTLSDIGYVLGILGIAG